MPRYNEDAEQAVVFSWAEYYPTLRWMHHIPNGGYRKPAEAARLKKQGVKPGVSDIFLPLAMGRFHGLYIEMKRRKKDGGSRGSSDQRAFAQAMIMQDFKCVICYGADEAIAVIKEYANI